MTPLALFRLAKPFLPYIGGALALLAAYLWIDHRSFTRGAHSRDAEVTTLRGQRDGWKQYAADTIREVRLKTAQAKADDLAHARAVESRDATTAKEHADALTRQLADSRSAALRYSRMLTAAQAHSGGGGGADLSGAPDAPGSPDGAGSASVMDEDLAACAAGVTKAEGWRAWWADIAKDPR